jgi:hypothetical protein
LLIKMMLIGPLSLRIPGWVWIRLKRPWFTPVRGADGR